jgi:hypothetical protein
MNLSIVTIYHRVSHVARQMEVDTIHLLLEVVALLLNVTDLPQQVDSLDSSLHGLREGDGTRHGSENLEPRHFVKYQSIRLSP